MKHIDDCRYQRQSRMTSYNNDKIKSISYNNSVNPKFFFFFFKCNFSNVQISQTNQCKVYTVDGLLLNILILPGTQRVGGMHHIKCS